MSKQAPRRTCLYLNNSPPPHDGERAKLGGGGISLLTLWKMLPELDWRACAVTPGEGPFTRAARDAGVDVTVYPYEQPDFPHPLRSLKNFASWRRIIKLVNPVIIHANAYDAARSAILSAASLRIKLVCHVRFPMTTEGKDWVFRGMPHPSAFIFNSQALLDETWPILGRRCPDSRAYVVHNAVDLSSFSPTPWPESAVLRVGIIGNFTPAKVHEDFLRMAAEVCQHRTDIEFWIIGEDTFGTGRDAELKACARALGIERNVKFLGHRSDIAALVAQLHLVVLTSKIEPFGRVLIEAMASRRPVIATRVGGIPEVVRHGKTGYLVDAGDYRGMASRVVELLSSRERWEELAQNALADAQDRFAVARHAGRIVQIYDEVLASA
jgi:glycosyltransferase involved in cell wall biosynthesis